jgi:hypothetical protein
MDMIHLLIPETKGRLLRTRQSTWYPITEENLLTACAQEFYTAMLPTATCFNTTNSQKNVKQYFKKGCSRLSN